MTSTKNVDLVRSIGADHVIDYTRDDFTEGAERYDLILDNVGNQSMARTRRALAPAGTLISNGGGHADGKLGRTVRAMLASMVVRQQAARRSRPRTATTCVRAEGPRRGRQGHACHRQHLPAAGTRDAIARCTTGHARGTIVITSDRRSRVPALDWRRRSR